ncbi:MAG: immune inhibitor A [Ignavibacteriaceae bacterium]|nr:immune inhibitor A [Ignavibacteriaceae bacterium]
MKFLQLLFVSLLFTAFASGQNYKQVKIYLNDAQKDMKELAQLDIDLEHATPTKDNAIIVFVSDEVMPQLSILPYRVEILIDDWFTHYESLPKLSEAEMQALKTESKLKYGVEGFGFGSMGGHLTLAEVISHLDSMKLLFPNLITAKLSIGNSVENRPMYMVKISDNPTVDEDEPEVLYTGLHHAREPMGMMNLIYFMYYLLENYNTNPEVRYLVDNRELYFIPVLNPDGYEYNRSTNPGGGGMWRKNRKNNGGSYGVDLNRNYGPEVYWNAPNGGSSTSPSSDLYRGTAPFSEPETQAVRDFLAARDIKNALNYHTFSNLLIYPYGALGRETPDSMTFREYAAEMTQYNGYSPGTDLQTVGYSTRGNSDDYFYDGDTVANGGKIFAMTPEVGNDNDYFWAPQNRIFPLAIENLYPNMYYAWAAGGFVRLQNITFDRQYFNPGDNVQMNIQVKNKGLSTAKNVNVEVTTSSPYVTMGTNTASTDSIGRRTVYTIPAPLSFSISPTAPADHSIKLVVKSRLEGVVSSTDTFTIITGTPVYYFADTTNNPANLWTVTYTPTSSPRWETFESSFHSAPNSYHDSKAGAYVSNATVTLTTTNNINLAGSSNPVLSFWTKYDIESSWDCGVVLISTNGSTWTPLAGKLTRPASGQGKQVPAGMPMYDNIRAEWTKEEMNLSAFGNQQIKLRFELRTDGSLNRDGWWIDDIGIIVYQLVPVELSSFTATPLENSVDLKWETSSEANNRGFEIQRSTTPGAWNTIGFIKGAGTTTEKTEYGFSDPAPVTGRISYRLKQFDFDGTSRLLAPVEVDFAGVTDYSLAQNYPNPFNPETVINFSLKQSGPVSLKLYNMLGKEVAVLINETMDAGNHSLRLDGSKLRLASGTYFYELKSGAFSKMMKLVYLK